MKPRVNTCSVVGCEKPTTLFCSFKLYGVLAGKRCMRALCSAHATVRAGDGLCPGHVDCWSPQQ